MWNLSFTPPVRIQAEVLTAMPDALRLPRPSAWADANKAGEPIDSFLEGPVFDRAGNLYVTDIPHGRILRIDAQGTWHVVAEYDGWPNGLAIHRDGSIWIADYRRGLLRLSPEGGQPETVLGHRNSESFKGINDLIFDAQGRCWFTDQGQTGMQDPSGRVYRYDPADGRLDVLLSNAPSPNGLALDAHGKAFFLAVTRGNAVWRGPVQRDGSLSKVGVLRTFFGTSGPDGLAVGANNELVVAHASLGGAFVLNAMGEVTHFVQSPCGKTITNLAFRPGTRQLVLTDSATGTVLTAELPCEGAALYSHA